MEITIKEPATEEEVRLNAEIEGYLGEQGWRIYFPKGDSFLLIRRDGDWVAADEDNLNPELISRIMEKLDEHDRYTHMSGT